MTELTIEIGKKIRNFRRMRKLTLAELAQMVCKSQSTISKYEKGEIAVDIETLYEIAAALQIHVEQLLFHREAESELLTTGNCPAFFHGRSQFYGYLFDGRSNRLIRCVFDVLSQTEQRSSRVAMYMNFRRFEAYQDCENTYWGRMEHYDALTNLILTNQDTPMERASLQILASYLDSDSKWGLFNGFSSRPMMPIATKMLLCKERQKEDEQLLQKLKISKEDIRLLKLYNMLSIT